MQPEFWEGNISVKFCCHLSLKSGLFLGHECGSFSSHKCKSVYKSLYIVHVYHVALNFCGSLILQMGDFLCFAGTNFAIGKNYLFLLGINFAIFRKLPSIPYNILVFLTSTNNWIEYRWTTCKCITLSYSVCQILGHFIFFLLQSTWTFSSFKEQSLPKGFFNFFSLICTKWSEQ